MNELHLQDKFLIPLCRDDLGYREVKDPIEVYIDNQIGIIEVTAEYANVVIRLSSDQRLEIISSNKWKI